MRLTGLTGLIGLIGLTGLTGLKCLWKTQLKNENGASATLHRSAFPHWSFPQRISLFPRAYLIGMGVPHKGGWALADQKPRVKFSFSESFFKATAELS